MKPSLAYQLSLMLPWLPAYDRRDALVVVLTGAGGVSGRALAELVQETAFRKNVKVISISLPGWGCLDEVSCVADLGRNFDCAVFDSFP